MFLLLYRLISIFFISSDEIEGIFNKRRTTDGGKDISSNREFALILGLQLLPIKKKLWII